MFLSPGVEGGWVLERGGLDSRPRKATAVGCGETDRGVAREEIVVGNACGGKPVSHGSKAILLSHM